MSSNIKYNAFGEVISVNGITTGQHIGTPMQDALGTPETNAAYGEELGTVTRMENTVVDKQPEKPTSGGGGASSWNDLTDKPFGDETPAPITWDGNPEGRDSIMEMLYKISDEVFTIDQLIGATVQRMRNGVITETVLDESHLVQIAEGCIMATDNGELLLMSSSVTGTVNGTNIPSTGTFGSLDKSGDWHVYLSCIMFPSKVKPLDEKYMPILTSPSGKKFKITVDDTGAITATEVTE